jgi:hypothetical protein
MILRRVIAHFRKQEWTAIALDFLIVVAGILIAFQITEWNGARRDRALEREYLERLHADIENTFESRTRAAQWDETRLAQQALVLNALRSGKLREEDRGAFNTGLAWFGFVSGPEVQWATIDELRSTGAMNLIRDVALRSAILDFDADLQRRQGITENLMESIYAFREELGGRYEVVNFAGERNDVELKYDFDALAADPAFLNALSQIDMLARFRLDMNRTVLADLAALRDDIARELEPGSRKKP